MSSQGQVNPAGPGNGQNLDSGPTSRIDVPPVSYVDWSCIDKTSSRISYPIETMLKSAHRQLLAVDLGHLHEYPNAKMRPKQAVQTMVN